MKTLRLLLASLWLLPLSVLASDGMVMEIGVSGMVCSYCTASVEEKLVELPGVKKVTVSLDKERAEIIMADGAKIDEQEVRRLINEAGFTPGEIRIH